MKRSIMKAEGEEILKNLQIELTGIQEISERYPVLKKCLVSVLQIATRDISLQFPDIYSRLVYVCNLYHFSHQLAHDIQSMRKHVHQVLLKEIKLTEEIFLSDLKALVNTVHHITQAEIPTELNIHSHTLSEPKDTFSPNTEKEHFSLLRFIVLDIEGNIISGKSEVLGDDIFKVVYEPETSVFKESYQLIKPGQIIHLIDCHVVQGEIRAEVVILEPDYLVDISAVAECFKDYGHHPYQYFINKLQFKENTTPMLLGNMANHFLDIFVHAPSDKPVQFNDTMKDIFKMYPFEISVNSDLDDREKKIQFFENSKKQFEHIKHIVRENFPIQNIEVKNAVLEPSFICSELGIQGRLDFLSIDEQKTIVIELKSGRAPFPENQYSLVADNHKAQLFLYQIVIQKVLKIPFKQLDSYLFYSKYEDPNANLRKVQPYMEGIKDILNVRNQIVAIERRSAEDETFFPKIIHHLSPELLANKGNVNTKFLNNYIFPQIAAFKSVFTNASELELKYFYHFYQFVSQEQYIAKSGVTHYDQSLGHASIWLSDIDDKIESGEILLDLEILENKTNDSTPIIRLQIPEYPFDFLPNFRKGDIVILYQRNQLSDNVTNKQIFRGSIIQITHQEITIRFRNSQSNTQYLPDTSKYAVEHDFMDASFSSMYRGLYQFLSANSDRKKLLLQQRPLEINTSKTLNINIENTDIQDIVLKSKQAKDYFLLLGPPGTGKTSVALKSMVEEFYSDADCNILLLSYTNRAVDEICASISQIDPEINFIRIGSEFATETKFHRRLLQNVIKDFDKREQVKDTLLRCRVFVGTVASISGKSELFKLKKFQVAIIDEASQILEPQILGILTMKHSSNQNAIEKFIMIGDHKQLPAIVLQSPEYSLVKDDSLKSIGIFDRRISLFERLFRYLQKNRLDQHWAMLKKQGRMHPEIASFANSAFYENQLIAVPTVHQQAPLEWTPRNENTLSQILSTKRVAFFPSQKVDSDTSFKINSNEVSITIDILKEMWELYQSENITFETSTSLGIITPYRSQIALIRKAIHELNIPELELITIDTVERFQGSQRDIIIYSFCVNHKSQLKLLSNSFEENGKIIDRKLNVALTRARKQMFLIGNPYFLSKDPVFEQMLQHYGSAATVIEPI